MVIYSGFTHWKWWFSIVMLNNQRVILLISFHTILVGFYLSIFLGKNTMIWSWYRPVLYCNECVFPFRMNDGFFLISWATATSKLWVSVKIEYPKFRSEQHASSWSVIFPIKPAINWRHLHFRSKASPVAAQQKPSCGSRVKISGTPD